MATEIICTACDEVFALEGDSVSLPFVCTDCEKKREEFALEATAAEPPATGTEPAAEVVESEQPNYELLLANQVIDLQNQLDHQKFCNRLQQSYVNMLQNQYLLQTRKAVRLRDLSEQQASTIRGLQRPWYKKLSDWYWSLGQYQIPEVQ